MGRNAVYTEQKIEMFCTIKEGQKLFRLSRNKLNEIGEKADAIVSIGRMKRIDVEKLKAYLNDNTLNCKTGKGRNDEYSESFVHEGKRYRVYGKEEDDVHKKFKEKYKEVTGIEQKNRIRTEKSISDDKICYNVYLSDDYEKFSRLIGNREIKRTRINKIKKNILEVGWLRNPILVNENYQIIDGQHRFEALKELGFPIEYVIDEGTSIQECQKLNMSQSNWTQIDYIKSYAENGNMDYVYLNDLIETYKGISINSISYAVCDIANASHSDISSGKFVCSEEQYKKAKQCLNYLIPLTPIFKKISGRVDYLQTGLVFIAKHEKNCDLERLSKKISTNYKKIAPPAEIREALLSLEEIYNSNCRGDLMNFKNDYVQYAKSLNRGTKHNGKHCK